MIISTSQILHNDQYWQKPIKLWLYSVAFLIFVMILVGGATRLTDSGLSITEWKPVTGIIPPLTESAWQIELEKYRQIPEYQLINKGMSMSDFQFIYWWEWGHRALGRLIGLAFFVPFVFFWAKGALDRPLKWKLSGLFILGGFQGFLGWWMVASGLTERVDVSQYRLAVHLTFATIIFAAIIWVAMSLGRRPVKAYPVGIRLFSYALLAAVFVQIFLGGLVAGLDAGMTYTSWPLMDGAFIPPASKLLSISPWWLNFGENVLTVQFVHRMFAYLFWILAFGYFVIGALRYNHMPLKKASLTFFLAVSLQIVFGVITLLSQVKMEVALFHQGFAAVLLSLAVYLCVLMRFEMQDKAAHSSSAAFSSSSA
jgi:cytochrome c oxidase assembly protein subunit 15